MTPLTLPRQVTLESRVTVGPGWCRSGPTTTTGAPSSASSTCRTPHDDLVVRATSTVETEPFPGIPAASQRPSWAQLSAEAAGGRLLEMMLATPLTTLDPSVSGEVVAELAGLTPDETAAAISARVRDRITYLAGATGVRTNAHEAWDKGQGVCQDMAQVTIALMHAAGLPARYVSGYLHPPASAEPGTTAIGQSHAWVEYWAGSWTALDPTSGAASASGTSWSPAAGTTPTSRR